MAANNAYVNELDSKVHALENQIDEVLTANPPPLVALFGEVDPTDCNLAFIPSVLTVFQQYGNPTATSVSISGGITVGHRPTIQERDRFTVAAVPPMSFEN